MLRRIAGPQTTMAAVLFGEVLDGAEAERVGLVHRCVDDDDLLAAAQDDGRPRRVGAARAGDRARRRRSRRWPTIDDHPAAVERELDPQVWSTQQPWFAERIAALQAKISKKPSLTPSAAGVAARRPVTRLGCRARGEAHTTRYGAPRSATRRSLDEPATPDRPTCRRRRRRSCGPRPTASGTGSTSSCRTSPTRCQSGLDPADVPRARRGLEADAPQGSRGRQGAGRQAQPRQAALEAEDVEAAHGNRQAKAEAIRSPAERPAVAGRAGRSDRRRQPGSAGSSVGSRRVGPLLDGEAVADVVLPHAVDLEEALGDALLADRQLLHHPPAVAVARHDADLEAVQVELLEGEGGDDDDALGDQPLPGAGLVDPVADRCRSASPRARRC